MRSFISVLVLALIATSVAEKLTVPMFMWSKGSFLNKNTEILDTVVPEDLSYALNRIAFNSASDSTKNLEAALNVNRKAEVVFLFVESELRTDTLSTITNTYHTAVVDILKNADVTVPYGSVGSHTNFADSAATRAVNDAGIAAENIIVSNGAESEETLFNTVSNRAGVRNIGHSSLVNYVKTHSALFSNGVADFILVGFIGDQYEAHSALIEAVLAEASEQGEYVAILTGNTPSSDIIFSFPAADSVYVERGSSDMVKRFVGGYYMLDANTTGNYSNSTNGTSVNYFSGPVLEMYFVSVVLLAMVFIGLCMICNVQTHDREFHVKRS